MICPSKIISEHPEYASIVTMIVIFYWNIFVISSIGAGFGLKIVFIFYKPEDMGVKPRLIPFADRVERNVLILV